MIRIFIGYEPEETRAYHVLVQSIHEHSSVPVSITPIRLSNLKWCFKRKKHQLQSTEFTFSRFLVPFLCDYEGWAIFMDCDMLCLDDINELWKQRDERYAVQCVKHSYVPKETEKFTSGVRPQTKYERKNWSSMMLFNNKRCTALTPEFVETASGLELHQFRWLKDREIGQLSRNWNHLVGQYPYYNEPCLAHFTTGGPWAGIKTDYDEHWFKMEEKTMHCARKHSFEQEAS